MPSTSPRPASTPNQGSRSAVVRASVDHPIIDADGHFLELELL
jgi:hypothetical protein